MKRLLAVLLLTIPLAACNYVTQTEFDQHVQQYQELRQSYDILLTQLDTWSTGMYDWAALTGNVICEVARANMVITAYPQRTRDYCGSGDPPGSPPAPPMWGQ